MKKSNRLPALIPVLMLAAIVSACSPFKACPCMHKEVQNPPAKHECPTKGECKCGKECKCGESCACGKESGASCGH